MSHPVTNPQRTLSAVCTLPPQTRRQIGTLGLAHVKEVNQHIQQMQGMLDSLGAATRPLLELGTPEAVSTGTPPSPTPSTNTSLLRRVVLRVFRRGPAAPTTTHGTPESTLVLSPGSGAASSPATVAAPPAGDDAVPSSAEKLAQVKRVLEASIKRHKAALRCATTLEKQLSTLFAKKSPTALPSVFQAFRKTMENVWPEDVTALGASIQNLQEATEKAQAALPFLRPSYPSQDENDPDVLEAAQSQIEASLAGISTFTNTLKDILTQATQALDKIKGNNQHRDTLWSAFATLHSILEAKEPQEEGAPLTVQQQAEKAAKFSAADFVQVLQQPDMLPGVRAIISASPDSSSRALAHELGEGGILVDFFQEKTAQGLLKKFLGQASIANLDEAAKTTLSKLREAQLTDSLPAACAKAGEAFLLNLLKAHLPMITLLGPGWESLFAAVAQAATYSGAPLQKKEIQSLCQRSKNAAATLALLQKVQNERPEVTFPLPTPKELGIKEEATTPPPAETPSDDKPKTEGSPSAKAQEEPSPAPPLPSFPVKSVEEKTPTLPSLPTVLREQGIHTLADCYDGIGVVCSPFTKLANRCVQWTHHLCSAPEEAATMNTYMNELVGKEVMRSLSSAMSHVEAWGNWGGRLPAMCVLTGALRSTMGLVQALFFSVFGLSVMLFSSREDSSLIGRCIIVEYAVGQGGANLLRGIIESSWLCSLTVLVPWDLNRRNFLPEETPSSLHLVPALHRGLQWVENWLHEGLPTQGDSKESSTAVPPPEKTASNPSAVAKTGA